MRILVVEDDPIQAEAVSTALSSLSHVVTIVDDGERAVRCLRSEPIDAVVLDWHLPRMSGIEVLHWIRARTNVRYGVLFLTSRVHEVDVVRALDAGAARDEQIRAGDYVLDPIERTVTLRGGRIELTTKEFQLVAALFTNLGKILSRDLLAMTAWGRELSVESRSLDTHIYRIRQKLKLSPENGLRLSSIYTLGYRLDLAKAQIESESCA
jgi:DNA-binding response OmpR family regulator